MQRCGVKLLASQYESIRDFYEQGITDDMLRYACDEAADHGTLSFAYIRKVVDGWICNGIGTIEAAKKQKADYEAKKERARYTDTRRPENPQQDAPKPKFFSERWNS